MLVGLMCNLIQMTDNADAVQRLFGRNTGPRPLLGRCPASPTLSPIRSHILFLQIFPELQTYSVLNWLAMARWRFPL